ncbi:MAG: preprotein translocase subunit SecG [bacterium]
MLTNILLVIHLLVAVAIVILVLLQQGKGSDMGAAFGGGSSQSLFGARGSANFLSRSTSLLVTVFFLSSLTLAYLYTRQSESTSVTAAASITDAQPSADAQVDPPAPDDAPADAAQSSDASDASDVPDVPAAPE